MLLCTRKTISLRLLPAILVAFCSLPLSAQDPFGDPGGVDLFGAPQPRAQVDEAAEEVSPITRQLLESSARGDEELVQAIASLARLGKWTEVDQLLGKLGGRNLNPEGLADAARTIGPALFMRMRQREELGDAARATLDELSKGSAAHAQSPDRLRAAIDQLDSPSSDQRLGAARTLLKGGDAAIAELAAAAVSASPSASQDEILRTMLQLGPGGIDALRQLALYGDAPVRSRAVQSLARVDRRAHLVDLITALYTHNATDAEVAMVKAHLAKMGMGVPSHGASIEYLTRDFERLQREAQLVENDDASTTLWSINGDGNGVTFQRTAGMLAGYRDVADAAARLRRVGGLNATTQGAALAADMAYRVMIDPDWGDPEQMQQIRESYGSAADGSALSSAIQAALAAGDHAAIIGLVRLINTADATVLERSLLLGGDGGLPAPLVQAASSTEPRVRYEAALAAARLADGSPYPGSSRVMYRLSEMRSLTARPTAVLVETRPDEILRIERILIELGYDVRVVGSVGRLQRLVARGGDIRLILSKTQLADLPPIELIDLVRRMDLGREIPIVFYGDQPSPGVVLGRWSAPTEWIDPPASVAALDGIHDEVKRKRRLPPLTAIDRQLYRDEAAELLGAIAQSR